MKSSANQEGLSDVLQTGLRQAFKTQTKLRSICHELTKAGQIFGSGDDQDFPNTGQHQCGQRVIDHGLVVDGQQAFAHGVSNRIKACARAAGVMPLYFEL